MRNSEDKIKNYSQIEEISKELRRCGKTIVTTNGSFDILHYAHGNLLEKARGEGDALVVLVNSDDSIKRFKGEKRPIIPQYERARMLALLESTDYIVIFDEDNPLNILEIVKPHVHVKGGSFIPERIKAEQEHLARWGGIFKGYELEEGISTTNIINTVLEKNGFREYRDSR